MPNCSVIRCRSRGGGDQALFKLPTDEMVKAKWLDFLVLSGKKVQDGKEYRVCELHFAFDDIRNSSSRRVLFRGAVPVKLDVKVS